MLRVCRRWALFIFLLLAVTRPLALAKKSATRTITGFIEKDVSGQDHLYVDTGSQIYILRFKNVYLNNQAVLKRQRLPNAQVSLQVKPADIIKVKKIDHRPRGYR